MNRPKTKRLIWWLQFTASFLLPWIIVIASNYVLDRWFPGQVKVDHWRDLSSISFLFGGLAAAFLLIRIPQPLFIRASGALMVITGSLGLALLFQMKSRCGDESEYVGRRADVQVASCN